MLGAAPQGGGVVVGFPNPLALLQASEVGNPSREWMDAAELGQLGELGRSRVGSSNLEHSGWTQQSWDLDGERRSGAPSSFGGRWRL